MKIRVMKLEWIEKRMEKTEGKKHREIQRLEGIKKSVIRFLELNAERRDYEGKRFGW